MPLRLILIPLVVVAALNAACRRDTGHDADAHDRDDASIHADAPAPTNRIDVPEAVRRNLGITFAAVESRPVARTLRIPGRFELLPEARREYRTMLSGRVELHVAQYRHVEPGDLLYTLDSPDWRQLQERLNETQAQIQQAMARVANIDPIREAHERHHEVLEDAVEIRAERVRRLEESGARGVVSAEELAQARAALASTRAELAEVMEQEAELRSRKVEVQSELHAARERFDLLLLNASALLGIPVARLAASDESVAPHTHEGDYADTEPHRHPVWRELRLVEVRAAAAGVVESLALTNGAWAPESALVLSTVRPELLRFHARGLQSDLGRLRDGLPATIVPPKGGSIDPADTLSGTLQLGLGGDPDERTVEVFLTPGRTAPWARPGVAAHLEITVEGSARPELALPVSATIRDGLDTVFFRRDPRDPNKVTRTIADLGVSDGRWVVVRSGVKEGDEVVLDGVYQLMLATTGAAAAGGHFHADGTFHEGKD